MSHWKYALASVAGTSHAKRGGTCQDASVCRVLSDPAGNPVLVAVASDGAGSAVLSEQGAQLACSLFVEDLEEFLADGRRVSEIDKAHLVSWLHCFQSQVGAQAQAQGATTRDFACTFLAAVVGHGHSVFAHVGDGAIVLATASEPGEYMYAHWPQKGEYENMTYFATDPSAVDFLEHSMRSEPVEEVALFTDGLQRLALDFPRREAYNPFFRPMFAPLRGANVAEDGFAESLSESLGQYLTSDRINERTDDDKTLVLATQRQLDRLESPEIAPEHDGDRTD